MALLGTVHGPTTRSLATNLFGVGEYAGVAMGGWFGSFVAQEFHWRWVFFCLGLVGMLYSFPYFGFLKKVGETTPRESQPSSKGLSIAVLVKIRTYRFICLVFPICFCVFWLLYTWLPLFLYEKFSLSLAQAGFTATVYLQSANLIGSLSGAALADWLYARTKASRLWVSVAGFFLSAPCLYFIGNSPSLALTITAAVGFGLFGGWFIGNITVASFDVVPAHTRASAYGCLNLTGSLVTGFASLLEGKLKQSLGIANMMSLAAIACVTAGVLVMVCIRFYFYSDHERMVCRDNARVVAPC
jgi:predicted MFS family arabinose efflux permease